MNQGEFHNLLFTYGTICEEEGLLSPKAVTMRMDIATFYNELASKYLETFKELKKINPNYKLI